MIKHKAAIGIGLILWLALGLILPAAGTDAPTPAGQPPAAGQTTADTPPPMTDIHDIRPPVPVGFDTPWFAVLLALVAAAILAVLWWWLKKRRRARTIETIVPELPPEMTAMRGLDEIADVRRLDGKTFYFRLSAIVRQYVLGRFAVGAPEMTTEEFVPCIDRLPIDRDLARRLKQLCRAMDPVKFGGVTTVEKQMEADLFLARTFVRQTTPEVYTKNRTGGDELSRVDVPLNGTKKEVTQ